MGTRFGELWPGLETRTDTPVNTKPRCRGAASRDTGVTHVAILPSLAPPEL